MIGLLFLTTVSQDVSQLLSDFESAWAGVQDYTCSLYNFDRYGDETEAATYYVQFMRPGWIKYTQTEGSRKGSKAVYNPNTGKVSASLGGILGFLKITTDPTDGRVTSKRGDRMDHSHFGWILKDWKRYAAAGKVSLRGEKTEDGVDCYVLVADGLDPGSEKDAVKKVMYLRKDHHLPYKTVHYDSDGRVILKAVFRDLKVNQGLSEKDFKI